MGNVALSGYLRQLRELQGLSRAYVARLACTSDQNIFRIEREYQEPRATMLAFMIQTLQADLHDVHALLLDDSLTDADGVALADERFAESRQNSLQECMAESVEAPQEVVQPPLIVQTRHELAELRQFVHTLDDRLQRLEE